MLPCTSGSVLEVFPENPMSLQRCGQEEAQRFKWIQSEKEGKDLGDHAIRLWISAHWNGFLRHRWLEHLQGKTRWIELQKEDFGLLQREFRNSSLLDPILNRLQVLKENLDIILLGSRCLHPGGDGGGHRHPRGAGRQLLPAALRV